MSINAIARGVTNFVKKHPVATAAMFGGAGLIAYSAVTATRKQSVDTMNHIVLANPVLNPLGWAIHAFNPTSKETNFLDSPILKYMVDKNNKAYEDYYNNLPPSKRVAEFYKNGGKGVTFENLA